MEGKDLAVFYENSKKKKKIVSPWIYQLNNQHSQNDPNVVKKDVKKRSPVEMSHCFLYEHTKYRNNYVIITVFSTFVYCDLWPYVL